MALIAIDLGTSYIKGAVLDLDTLRIEHIHRVPFPPLLSSLPPLYREFDPGAILATVHDLLKKLIPLAGHPDGLVMCSQMHGLVLTNQRGEPKSNLITWQDERILMPHPSGQGTYFDVMMRQVSAEERRQLGNELRPGLPIGLLFWLRELGQLPGREVVLASLPDFVIANLCDAIPVTEVSHAQAHGALNLETLGWHTDVLARLGLDGLRWPTIRPQGTVSGVFDFGTGRMPCYTPVGDYQCALVGALLQPGELSLNISTGSQVSMLKPRLESGPFQTRPFFDGQFLSTVTTIPAGRALNALVHLLSELAESQGVSLADPWSYIAQRAAEVEPQQMRVNLAFYASAVGDHGEVTNIREAEMTVGHLFRAAFQNMAENYLVCARRISPEQRWTNLVFSGGLAQKIELLRHEIAAKFGVPARICPTPEDTLLGLLVLGLAFTGRAESVERAMTILRKSPVWAI